MRPVLHDPKHVKGVRTVATVEFTKGVIVVLVGLGALTMRHKDFWGLAESFLHFFNLNFHNHYLVGVFTTLVSKVHDVRVWKVALILSIYVILRFVEAFGLWYALPWAEWMAAITGGIYIPFEVADLMQKVTWFRVAVIIVNTGVVLYMLSLRLQAEQKRRAVRR